MRTRSGHCRNRWSASSVPLKPAPTIATAGEVLSIVLIVAGTILTLRARP